MCRLRGAAAIMTKRAIVLLSGGLDSATVLAMAKAQGFETYALSMRYGQRHSSELEAATRVASALAPCATKSSTWICAALVVPH